MLVQIYEVQTPEEARALASLGVDHIGVLVGDGAFPRELSTGQANAIFAAVPAGKKRVALSLSADPEAVARVARETRPDIIQLQAALEDFSVAMTRVIKRVAGTYRYYLTRIGRAATAALGRVTQTVIIPALA